MTGPTDDELRAMWRNAGGRFYGPHVETGAMPERELLAFLRAFAAGSRSGEDARDAARWRHVCKTRHVLLLTGYFGNGCVNKSIADVEAEIDTAMGGNDAKP